MPQYITAARLYDYTQCPHRVWRDVYGPQNEKIKETNPFIELLWERGIAHEQQVVSEMGVCLDLEPGTYEERFKETIKAMEDKVPLIYQGVLICKNMLGIPDLLKRLPDGRYIPIEIKSGLGFEGMYEEEGDAGRPKKHYAVQLALYSDLLNRLGFDNRRQGIIIDIRTDEVPYDLSRPLGKRDTRTLWQFYKEVKTDVWRLVNNAAQNKPALAGICKLCPWYRSCKNWVTETDDLTRIYYLGRSKRDVINADLGITKATDILSLDIKEILRQKTGDSNCLKGVGEKTLKKIIRRAHILLKTQKPVAYTTIEFPKVSYELYFDIEDDPTREFVYMHGLYVKGPEKEEYRHFTAAETSKQAEKKAWQGFWNFIHSLPPNDYAVYYYSHHEKATYRKMQKSYPDVISEDELDAFFDHPNVIDLFAIVSKHTDWPVSSYSLKDLAQYLGFNWRDESPSGAASIQWFNEFINTGVEKILDRLLAYNEDDCKATMVLKQALEKLPIYDSWS